MTAQRTNEHGVVVTPWWGPPAAALVRFLRGYGFVVFLFLYLHVEQDALVRVVRLVQDEAPSESVGYFLELVTFWALLWVLWRLICAVAMALIRPHLQGVNYWALLPENRPRGTASRGEV